MTADYTPDPKVHPAGAPPLLRGRGDRRGFEPLDPGPLPPPTRSPPATWKVADLTAPVWTGRRVDKLIVDISAGGLGDAVRMFALVAGLRRRDRAAAIEVVGRPGRPGSWLRRALQPLVVYEPTDHVEGDAILPPFHVLPMIAYKEWLHVSSMATAARILGLPLESIAGPCFALDAAAVDLVRRRVREGGWDGAAPIVAIQTNGHAVGPPLTQAVHHEKVPPALHAAIAEVQAMGCFPIALGSALDPDLTGPVLDLGGCALEVLAAAMFVADVAVTGDSGPLHVASAVGTPVVALFGPSDPRLHVCGAGVWLVQPHARACPHIPCGVGSMFGGPTGPDRRTRIPMPCPPQGGCLSRMTGAEVGRAVRDCLDALPN